LYEIGPGNSSAAAATERAINHFEPNVLLLIGVAGGLKDVALGDVVAATKVYGYESGKSQAAFRSRPSLGQSSFDLVERARAEARNNRWLNRIQDISSNVQPRVHVAPIAAGEKVVASRRSHTCRLLREAFSDAIAVEMEGEGFCRAAYANQSVS